MLTLAPVTMGVMTWHLMTWYCVYCNCSGTTNGYSCHACPNVGCAGNEYRSGSCGGISNPTYSGYKCNACKNIECASGSYRKGTCAGTHNGYSCAACANVNCPTNKYVLLVCMPGIRWETTRTHACKIGVWGHFSFRLSVSTLS